MKYMYQPANASAKPPVLLASLAQTHFFSPGLTHRILDTARFALQKENDFSLRVQPFLGVL